MNSWPKGVYLQSITHTFPTQYRLIWILIQSCFVDQQSVGPLISYCDHFVLSTYQLRGQDLGHKYFIDLVRGQCGWILAKLPICVFMDRTSLANKGIII